MLNADRILKFFRHAICLDFGREQGTDGPGNPDVHHLGRKIQEIISDQETPEGEELSKYASRLNLDVAATGDMFADLANYIGRWAWEKGINLYKKKGSQTRD